MGVVIRIAGEAGWGLASATDVLSKIFLNLGYYVFSSKEYASQIKMGHNYHTIRVSEKSVNAEVETLNVLLALNKETLEKHLDKVAKDGIILYDNSIEWENKDERFIAVNVVDVEKELKEKNLRNAIFLGSLIRVLGLDYNILAKVLSDFFQKKPDLKELLLKVSKIGFDAANFTKEDWLKNLKTHDKDFLNGNSAVSKGAIKAGLTFHAQYPMTPVSGILHNLAKESVKNENLVVIQPEDEIAAINMVLGASYAGRRAMTATSGGGFSLMVESFGLTSMAEVPLVLIEGQRPGPATGLPTKTGQGDLKFMLSAGQGDFPRVVIAPGNVAECYTETKRAFYLAEKYQLPVVVMTDTVLAESFETLKLDDFENDFTFEYDKRIGIVEKVSDADLNEEGLFKRYGGDEFRRTIPGNPKGIYTCAGDEHDEVGEITEDRKIRIQMMNRRMGKLDKIREELPKPELFGVKNSDLMVVAWGSNSRTIKEVVEKLNSEGKKVNFLQVKYMSPFKNEVADILTKAKKLVLLESNYSAQLGKLIRENTGIKIVDKILRFDGGPFTVDLIYNELVKRL